MASNTFGRHFQVTTYGESHGASMGFIIDGCPAGLPIDLPAIQQELDRRKPGQSKLTTQRKEDEEFTVESGVYEGKTLGGPIAIRIPNKDAKSKDYQRFEHRYRPSHADYTYDVKYGQRDHRGGGRSSARETANWVAAGAVAKQLIQSLFPGIAIRAFVTQIGKARLSSDWNNLDLSYSADPYVRCPEPEAANQMVAEIEDARKAKDSVGGTIGCDVRPLPSGLGEPVFQKLESDLAAAMLSINASKGFEIGMGFNSAGMRGSAHNDTFYYDDENQNVRTRSNHAGGTLGGISNGEPLQFQVAFKPVATIAQAQSTVDSEGNAVNLEGKGRHDPCVVPRGVPIVEAMTALVLADHALANRLNKL
jgi:chorismate synthase